MRISAAVTSVSWIPSASIPGLMKLPFELGVAHYDEVPPDRLGDLEALRAADRFRFANELRGWIDVEDGVITGHGQSGGIRMGSTTIRLGRGAMTFAAVRFPELRPAPEVEADRVRFTQTVGGRTAVPAPRRVSRPPYVQILPPTVWTTLTLTLYADGRVEYAMTGASPFPRHWVYGPDGALTAKSGVLDAKQWSQEHFGAHSPWGEADAPAIVAAVESELERRLSALIMHGRRPQRRRIPAGQPLLEQGALGTELYLLLDGVLAVEVDGAVVAEVGPGAVLGERAALEQGRRTATLRAITGCHVAVARAEDLDPAALTELAEGHRREEG